MRPKDERITRKLLEALAYEGATCPPESRRDVGGCFFTDTVTNTETMKHLTPHDSIEPHALRN